MHYILSKSLVIFLGNSNGFRPLKKLMNEIYVNVGFMSMSSFKKFQGFENELSKIFEPSRVNEDIDDAIGVKHNERPSNILS